MTSFSASIPMTNLRHLTAEHVEAPIRVATTQKASKWVDTILSCSNRQGLTDNEPPKRSALCSF